MHKETLLALIGFTLIATTLSADEKPDPAILTLERIYGKGEFKAKSISARWLEGEDAYLTVENAKGGGQRIVKHGAETSEKTVLVSVADLTPSLRDATLRIDDYSLSQDRARVLIYTKSKRVWRRNTRGDYWVLDRSSHEITKLGGEAQPSSLMFAKFSPDGKKVAYVRDNDIFVEELSTHHIKQLTHRETPDIINGTFDWVYEEELFLRDGFRWSPDGKQIAFWQLDTSSVREVTLVDNLGGLYPKPQRIKYPKAGETNVACRVGVVSIATGNSKWLSVPGDPRNHYIARMEWAERSDEIVLQQLNRLQNTNRVMLANTNRDSVHTIYEEQDDAWVNIHDEMEWFEDGKQFTWISEADGWRHVRRMSRSGTNRRTITTGEYDVIRMLHIDETNSWCYFLASPDNPTQRYLYRIRLDGASPQRITPPDQSGTHSYQISPSSRYAIHTRSAFGEPSVAELIRISSHETVRTLVDNKALREKVGKLKLGSTEFFRVDIGDGIELDGWCIKPTDFNAAKKYPLLVYVYGEPAGQTVLDRWGGSGYLWHQMLAQQGYVVMSFDNRGTPAARGRAWRKSVYRQVGILAPQDQAAAVRAVLTEREYVDPDRVGIWGWSGGGSMSLNAIFKYPDLYKTAISIAPVPNQRFYDTIYQERYMGLPKDNVDGFLNGSPINFAHQLKGNLLIVHGTGDDNCHYQGTEALINELIRHNKPFTMMAYPSRSHSIGEGKNTTRHLRELMTAYLHEHLPAGPR
ncbi:MAG: S9 family peptidase [Planctomycetaceae bacterium]|nr:S9 family peptidase [Planctomycetaceae bacterium]